MVSEAHKDLAGLMRGHGILPTQQRMMLAKVLFEQNGHFSADQLMRQVNGDSDRVSKATVYNTLGLFARQGLLREIIVDPTRVFYCTNTEPHHHLYNIDTGELQDIETDSLVISDLPALPEGTVADGVDVIIRVRNDSDVN
ncbi:MAG: transcriptional repressor [Gammaproteobacteria bacterium]|nr:transcriptional repressor [Gammaproteobacteria bacterium]